MERKSFNQLAWACMVAGVMGAIIFSRIGHRFLPFIPVLVQYAISLLYLLTLVVLIFVWKRKANNHIIDLATYTAFWQNAVRYLIALDLTVFGFEKFFHLQFAVPLGMLDDPFSAIPREMLMWAFYGHFRSMVIVIACVEIGGSLLLLFRRTRLLGAIVLMPIMLNIVMIDYLYLDLMVQLYATLETLAIIYLVALEYDRLVDFFFTAKSNLPAFNLKSNVVKNAIRLSVIVIPLLLHAGYNLPKDIPQITGKYQVQNLTINDTIIVQDACRGTLPSKVFIDRTDFVLGYTDYRKKVIGKYQYNETTKEIKVIWLYPASRKDTLVAEIRPGKDPEIRIIEGRMGKAKISMKLVKVAPLNY